MSESIVAAALKVENFIVSAPPPARHHTLLHALHNAYGKRGPMVKSTDQGFVTSAGRFVGREEAVLLAVAAGQILRPKFQPTQLFSEDLW
jgi:hypothetical protein